MKIATIDDTEVAIHLNASCEQVIAIADTPAGRVLATLLDPAGENRTLDKERQSILLQHNSQLDAYLVQYIDLFAELRRRAPRLVQLDMFTHKTEL